MLVLIGTKEKARALGERNVGIIKRKAKNVIDEEKANCAILIKKPDYIRCDLARQIKPKSGGGSLLSGIDDLIVEKTKIPVTLVDEPLTTVVRGTAKLLDDENMLTQVKVTGGLR